MPELPEVEAARRRLLEWIGPRALLGASGVPSRVLRGVPPERFDVFVKGRALERVERRGKHLLLVLSGDRGLAFHLGMSGRFDRRVRGDAPFSHERLALQLEDGQVVAFRDARMFGAVELGRASELWAAQKAQLGPDALSEPLSAAELFARLAQTRRPVKIALLDQALLAGLGNIQVSEALFRAGIHPARPANALTRDEVSRLLGAMRASISETLETLLASDARYLQEGAENHFRVYGREGELCSSCRRAKIVRSVQGARSTFFCPRCQRAPRSEAQTRS